MFPQRTAQPASIDRRLVHNFYDGSANRIRARNRRHHRVGPAQIFGVVSRKWNLPALSSVGNYNQRLTDIDSASLQSGSVAVWGRGNGHDSHRCLQTLMVVDLGRLLGRHNFVQLTADVPTNFRFLLPYIPVFCSQECRLTLKIPRRRMFGKRWKTTLQPSFTKMPLR